MASKTPNLDLLKKDPVADGNDTFNIETMLNENWDKIDAAVGEVREELKEVHVPSATLTEPGIVQLSSATNSSSEALAATPKAVKSAYDAAVAAKATASVANSAAATAQNTANSANSAAAAAQNSANAANNAVGPLASLLTGVKSNTVAAINELFTNVSDGKNTIASAITGKGVPASGSDTFSALAGKIGKIDIKGYEQINISSQGDLETTDSNKFFNICTISNNPDRNRILLVGTRGAYLRANRHGYLFMVRHTTSNTALQILSVSEEGYESDEYLAEIALIDFNLAIGKMYVILGLKADKYEGLTKYSAFESELSPEWVMKLRDNFEIGIRGLGASPTNSAKGNYRFDASAWLFT
ncbi:phage tail protein [Paenibacillus sp. alder61]|nr:MULTISPECIES: phage tail protein [Paenibacillus]MCA1293716.1 phage tail protein [Paenibacillus sp. alder61]